MVAALFEVGVVLVSDSVALGGFRASEPLESPEGVDPLQIKS